MPTGENDGDVVIARSGSMHRPNTPNRWIRNHLRTKWNIRRGRLGQPSTPSSFFVLTDPEVRIERLQCER